VQSEPGQPNKNKTITVIVISLIVFAVVLVISMLILSKINEKQDSDPGSQEQFQGQAQSSEQLQSECQLSARSMADESNIQRAFKEFKKNAEACLDVYVTLDEKKKEFRSEGMYADLSADLIKAAFKTDKKLALEILLFSKQLPEWEFYNGPVVCPSTKVLEAYEQSLKSPPDKLCIKPDEYKSKVVPELRAKNFDFLFRMVPAGEVVWIGTSEGDSGCPKKFDEIMKLLIQSAGAGVELREEERANEMNQLSAVFGDKSNTDKVILQFSTNAESCLRFESVLVQNSQTNE
jgi:hypothetical protein